MKIAFIVVVFAFASIALADDIKTTDGREYKNASITKVEPDGITITTDSGVEKIPFAKLPKVMQVKFGYDPAKAAAYAAANSKAQSEMLEAQLKRQKEAEAAQRTLLEKNEQALNQQAAPTKTLEWNVSFYESKVKSLKEAISDPHYGPDQREGYQRNLQQAEADLEKAQDELEKAKDSPDQYAAYQLKKKSQEFPIEIIQVISGGVLADPLDEDESGHSRSGKIIFVQGGSGAAEGERMQIKAYRDGTYTFRDTNGASRTIEKWILVN